MNLNDKELTPVQILALGFALGAALTKLEGLEDALSAQLREATIALIALSRESLRD